MKIYNTISEEEIHTDKKMETKNFTLQELINLFIALYKKSSKTKVKWHSPDKPRFVVIDFIDSCGNEFESIVLEKATYKEAIKPAIAQLEI